MSISSQNYEVTVTYTFTVCESTRERIEDTIYQGSVDLGCGEGDMTDLVIEVIE